MLHIFCVG